jgi:hypothetical protein
MKNGAGPSKPTKDCKVLESNAINVSDTVPTDQYHQKFLLLPHMHVIQNIANYVMYETIQDPFLPEERSREAP